MLIGDDFHNYFYDDVGNIITYKKNGTLIGSYTYDSLNQLKTETRANGDVYEYTYDNGGNILNVKKNDTVINTYTYGDEQWYDLLTAFNGDTITYDSIGNPLQYRDGFTFTWQNGRQLSSVTDSDYFTTYYQYNADGLRTFKNAYGLHVYYYWVDGMLVAQRIGPKYTIFLYDDTGSPYGFVYDNVYYYYLKNQQGDVIGILDADGNIIVNYEYSAWGEILSITGSHASTIGQTNPLRYRGYYYNDETGFYYLQSRYYDPITHRFINADSLIDNRGIITQNLFQYCGNNPVNNADSTGYLFIGALVGGVVGGLVGCLGALVSGKSLLVGMATGALAGAAIGAVGDAVVTGGLSLAVGTVVCGAISATSNFANQVANNYIEISNNKKNSKNKEVAKQQNKSKFKVASDTIVESVAQVQYDSVVKSAVISMCFAPVSFETGDLVNSLFAGCQPNSWNLASEIIGSAFMEINNSLIQFIIDIF